MRAQVSTQFPSEWVRRKRRDNFHVTVVGTIGSRTAYHWVVVVTSGTNFSQQVVEVDFVYPSEAIHLYWDQGALLALPADTGQGSVGTKDPEPKHKTFWKPSACTGTRVRCGSCRSTMASLFEKPSEASHLHWDQTGLQVLSADNGPVFGAAHSRPPLSSQPGALPICAA